MIAAIHFDLAFDHVATVTYAQLVYTSGQVNIFSASIDPYIKKLTVVCLRVEAIYLEFPGGKEIRGNFP